jgi:mannose/fructose/N-acetylgalactosamine-specific phosphotransferase system component IID
MIDSYKRKANIAGAICMAALIGPVVAVNVLAWTGHKVVTGDDAIVLAEVIMIALALPYFYGTWAYLKAKGRSGAWVLLAGTLIGMIVILLLKDHAKDG